MGGLVGLASLREAVGMVHLLQDVWLGSQSLATIVTFEFENVNFVISLRLIRLGLKVVEILLHVHLLDCAFVKLV